MHVLGATNQSNKPTLFNPTHLQISTDPLGCSPQIFCPSKSKITVQVIVFDRPSPSQMQYMSLNPISLALGDSILYRRGPSYVSDVSVAELRDNKLIEKLRLHTVLRKPLSQKELCLRPILNQINSSSELAQLISENIHLVGKRERRTLSVSERMVESAATMWELITFAVWRFWKIWTYPVLTKLFVIGLICHRVAAEIVLCVLEWHPRPESAALKDVSATAQQVDIRLQQFCYWPIQYATLRKRRNDWDSVTDKHADYIRFYNSLWLVANDVIIGIALGSYIIDNSGWVALQINRVLSEWTIEGLERMIKWLMGWPAGLKLNNELAMFLGDLVLWVIEYWSGNAHSTTTSGNH